jgi:hypothetical protein
VRGIDQSLVDEVWRELASFPPGRVEAEAAAFIAQQPHVAAFARTMTREQDPAVQKAALGLCFLVFKILERSLGRPFPPVAEARIAAAWELTQGELAHAETADPASVLARAADPAHPTLVAHILSVFYDDGAAPGEYDEGVRASLLLLLTALTGALDLGAVEA